MGRLPNDGRGRIGGRLPGTPNKPKTYAGWARRVLEYQRKQGNAFNLGTSSVLLAALVIADALAGRYDLQDEAEAAASTLTD